MTVNRSQSKETNDHLNIVSPVFNFGQDAEAFDFFDKGCCARTPDGGLLCSLRIQSPGAAAHMLLFRSGMAARAALFLHVIVMYSSSCPTLCFCLLSTLFRVPWGNPDAICVRIGAALCS